MNLRDAAEKARAVYDAVNEALKPLPPSKYKRDVLNAAWSGMGAAGAALENANGTINKDRAYLARCAKLLNWVTLPPVANEQQLKDWIGVAEICLSYRDIPLPKAGDADRL